MIRNRIKLENISFWIVFIFTVLAVASNIFYAYITRSGPNEFRELTLVKYAVDFADGINPYSLKLLESDMPSNAGCYGFVVPLIMSVVMRLVPADMYIFAYEFCTILASVVSMIFFAKALSLRGVHPLFQAFGALSIFMATFSYPYPVAMTEQYGFALATILMYLVIRDEKRGLYHPVIYAILLVIMFYIKQYYILIGFALFVYLLIKMHRDALRLFVIGIIMGITSVVAVWFIFPLYFPLAIARANLDATMDEWSYSFAQIKSIVLEEQPVAFVFFIIGIILVTKRVVDYRKYAQDRIWGKFKYSLRFELAAVVILLPFALYLARNVGQIKSYIYEIWVPYMAFCGLCAVQELFNKSNDWNKILKHLTVAILCILTVLGGFGVFKYEYKDMSPANYKGFNEAWDQAYALIDKYASDGEVLIPAHLSAYCLANNRYADDYGQAEYMGENALGKFRDNKLYSKIFPNLGKLMEIDVRYEEQVKRAVSEGKFKLVVVCDGIGRFKLNDLDLNENYEEVANLTLRTGGEYFPTYFLVLKDQ